jgi:hypothetical protein
MYKDHFIASGELKHSFAEMKIAVMYNPMTAVEAI